MAIFIGVTVAGVVAAWAMLIAVDFLAEGDAIDLASPKEAVPARR